MILTVLNILPDLGRYADYVWSSYSLSLGALLVLAIVSWRKKDAAEQRLKKISAKKTEKKT